MDAPQALEPALEGKHFASFDKLPLLREVQNRILALDWHVEPDQTESQREHYDVQIWNATLAEYQEQAYLLDPYLEDLVTPVVNRLREHAKECVANPSTPVGKIRIVHLSKILYGFVKFRGYKAIIRFFPHEIADLSIALGYMQLPDGLLRTKNEYYWTLRYILLLWLSLILMIPFDLAQFDEEGQEGKTARDLYQVANRWLDMAGLDREGAALILSRLLMRKDTGLGFHNFIEETQKILRETDDIFKAIGHLQVLCEVVKSGPAHQVQSEVAGLLDITNVLAEKPHFTLNTILRKIRIKLISRVALRLLPGRPTRKKQVRTLSGIMVEDAILSHVDEQDVPEEVESVLEQLFEALQDKDTVVRWTTAKGIGRIAERLPVDFANQVLDNLLGLFEIHSIAAASIYDLPATAESTWHGACLACAEMARLNLVGPDHLPNVIEWLSKALYFDLRKGAHSIGANVRDAAAYVLWALARTLNQASLAPYSLGLARHVATVALYDREVHIRRAASAAYQEHVGRTGLFPHGIDILAKMDFYAVSVRRNAFLVAAPLVAEHIEYRPFLIDHILNVVLRHWDASMRELGSQSLRLISFYEPELIDTKIVPAIVRLLASLDASDIHGGLLALTELAIGYRSRNEPGLDDRLRSIFKYVNNVKQATISLPRNELVAIAICRLISTSIIEEEVTLGEKSVVPGWMKVIDLGLKHKNPSVQEAAAEAMGTISNMTDCSVYITRLMKEMRSGLSLAQQSLARVLSVINYDIHPNTLPEAVSYLLECIKAKSKTTIETRRSCVQAIPCIVSTVLPHLTARMSSDSVTSLLEALLQGLEDYTIDERGDVGSWVRIASVQGLYKISSLLMDHCGDMAAGFEKYFPPELYHKIVAGILKQGMERLDNVRQEAGQCFTLLLARPLLELPGGGGDRWQPHNVKLLRKLFGGPSDGGSGWQDGVWLFPRAFRILEIAEYRQPILSGLLISIGSRTDSIQRPVANSLVEFAQKLPLTGGAYSLTELITDLINHAKSSMTSNTIVIPVFQAFNVLFDQRALNPAVDHPAGRESLRTLLTMATKNIDRMKNVQRIHEAMKIAMNLLAFEPIRQEKISVLRDFLVHPFPKIRADTAEFLFTLFQIQDFGPQADDAESLLLETEWVGDISVAKEKADEVINVLSSS